MVVLELVQHWPRLLPGIPSAAPPWAWPYGRDLGVIHRVAVRVSLQRANAQSTVRMNVPVHLPHILSHNTARAGANFWSYAFPGSSAPQAAGRWGVRA